MKRKMVDVDLVIRQIQKLAERPMDNFNERDACYLVRVAENLESDKPLFLPVMAEELRKIAQRVMDL